MMILAVTFPGATIPGVQVSFIFFLLPVLFFSHIVRLFSKYMCLPLSWNLGNKRSFGDLEDDEVDIFSSKKVYVF